MAKERVDTVITHSLVVTMDPGRTVGTDGAIAVRGSEVAAVGKTADLEDRFEADETVDGTRFVVVPGMVNTHIHITGEPLTRGFVPDDTPFEENVFVWLCPLYAAHTESDERISAQLAAAEMLKSGTTSFLEAGTMWHVDAVVDGLEEIGIRARVGRWVWDLPPEPAKYAQSPDDRVESGVRREPDREDAGDGRRRCERVHRDRRQQRVELLGPLPRHVPGGRAVQGRPPRPHDVPRGGGLRDGHARGREGHPRRPRDRLDRGGQEGRSRPPR